MPDKAIKPKVRSRLRNTVHRWCDGVELGLAVIVGLVLVITAVLYVLTFLGICSLVPDTAGFQIFLKNIFNIVVGLEFIKMLLKPNVKNVLDVLIFLVARHLIIDHGSPLGMLLCVLCIILLYGFWFGIKYMRLRDETFRRATDADIMKNGPDNSTGSGEP